MGTTTNYSEATDFYHLNYKTSARKDVIAVEGISLVSHTECSKAITESFPPGSRTILPHMILSEDRWEAKPI